MRCEEEVTRSEVCVCVVRQVCGGWACVCERRWRGVCEQDEVCV